MSLLEGVTTATTKAQLLDKLREADRQLQGVQDARVGQLQELEERLRAKFQAARRDTRQILLVADVDELTTAIDFLENFEDLLPSALARVYDGMCIVTGKQAAAA